MTLEKFSDKILGVSLSSVVQENTNADHVPTFISFLCNDDADRFAAKLNDPTVTTVLRKLFLVIVSRPWIGSLEALFLDFYQSLKVKDWVQRSH